MPIVRAASIFLPIYKWADRYLEELCIEISKYVDIFKHCNLNPWSIRIIVPPIPEDIDVKSYCRFIECICSRSEYGDILKQLLPISVYNPLIDSIIDLLNSYDRLYASILYDRSRLDEIADLYLLCDDPNIYTRMSITYDYWIQTPYFPSTSNIRNLLGFSISLRYVDLFKHVIQGDYTKLLNYLTDLASKVNELNIPFVGLDYSLSPWMDESIAGLIRDYLNIELRYPGLYYAVYYLNRLISNVISYGVLKAIGYNEVMLPVAEDNILKKAVSSGDITLRDLEGLASVCVAGLDMAAVPARKEIIRNILLDMESIHSIKRKTIGVRLIPAPEDIEYIDLKKFGRTPVFKIRVTK